LSDTRKHPGEDHERIPIPECEEGRVYKLRCRNFSVGVFDGKDGFIGIRIKFGQRFLATEYHWDQGPPYGTVSGIEDMGMKLPEDISAKSHLDTGPVASLKQNQPLFEFLDGLGDDGMRSEYDFSDGKKYKVVKVERGQKEDNRGEDVPSSEGEVGKDS
jgi:hypothetical protein